MDLRMLAHTSMLAAALAAAVPYNRAGAEEPKRLPRFERIEHVIVLDPQTELGMYFHMLAAPDNAPDELLPVELAPGTRMRPVLAPQVRWFMDSPERIKDALSNASTMQSAGVERSIDAATSAAGAQAAGAGLAQRPVGISEGAFNSVMLVAFIFAFWFISSEYKETLERRAKFAADLAAPVIRLPTAVAPATAVADRVAQALPMGTSVARVTSAKPAEFFEDTIAAALAEHPRVLVAVPFVGLAPGLAGVRCSTMLFDLVPNPERARRGPSYIRKTAAGPYKVLVSPFKVERTVVLTALSMVDALPPKTSADVARLEAQARERFVVGKAVGPRRNSLVKDLEHALDEARAPHWYPNQLAPRLVEHWTADSGAPLKRSIDNCAATMQAMTQLLMPEAPAG